MRYLIKIKTLIKDRLSKVRNSANKAAEYTREETAILKLKKDLFLKKRELTFTIAELDDKSKEEYNEKGNIYRKDISDIMHRVTLIQKDRININNKIDHVHDHTV